MIPLALYARRWRHFWLFGNFFSSFLFWAFTLYGNALDRRQGSLKLSLNRGHVRKILRLFGNCVFNQNMTWWVKIYHFSRVGVSETKCHIVWPQKRFWCEIASGLQFFLHLRIIESCSYYLNTKDFSGRFESKCQSVKREIGLDISHLGYFNVRLNKLFESERTTILTFIVFDSVLSHECFPFPVASRACLVLLHFFNQGISSSNFIEILNTKTTKTK